MANLLVETDGSVRHITLDRDHFTIGRLSTNDIVIPRQQVSRYHAELRATPDGWWIADLESTNGLQVDGVRVRRRLLRSGDRVELAPSVFIALLPDYPCDDIAVRPTAHIPALIEAPRRPGNAVARAWQPVSSATAWGAAARDAHSQGSTDNPASIEGDLFRRRRSRASGAPNGDRLRSTDVLVYGAAASYLHLCQTCGQQTAPDGIMCQACGSSIGRACGACGLSLLPVQDVCPRCQSANPASVLRARRAPSSV